MVVTLLLLAPNLREKKGKLRLESKLRRKIIGKQTRKSECEKVNKMEV